MQDARFLATDGSEEARWAGEMLLTLPLPQTADVTILTAIEVPHPPFTSLNPMARQAYNAALGMWQREAEGAASKALGVAREALAGGVASLTTRVQQGPAAAAIIEAAEAWGADLIAVGSHGLCSVKDFLLGSVSQKVVRYAPCSVLLAKRPVGKLQRVLLGADGSPYAEAAIRLWAGLALPPNVAVHLCAVAELPALLPPNARVSLKARVAALLTLAELERAAAERALVDARRVLETSGCAVTTSLRTGHAAGQLLEAIREFCPDLAVIGAKGRTGAKRFVLGSVAQKVIKYAPCSVVVVRP